MGNPPQRFIKPDGETFWSTKAMIERYSRLNIKPYPPRIWRKQDWKEYYIVEYKPKRLTDRQWALAMLILSAILATVSGLILKG